MGKIISTMIRKGGSGKTTTAVNLASGLAKYGKKVLLLDLDSQANASQAVGVVDNERNIARVLGGKLTAEQAIQAVKDFYLLASTPELADYEPSLTARFNLHAIKSHLHAVKDVYDYIVIDTPPSDGILTRNGLVASDGVIIPAQAHTFAIKGILQGLELIDSVKQTNPSLTLIGILPTMLQANTNIAELFIEQLKADYADKLLPYPIPLTVKVTESQLANATLLDYEPSHPASKAYKDLAEHIINNNEEKE